MIIINVDFSKNDKIITEFIFIFIVDIVNIQLLFEESFEIESKFNAYIIALLPHYLRGCS